MRSLHGVMRRVPLVAHLCYLISGFRDGQLPWTTRNLGSFRSVRIGRSSLGRMTVVGGDAAVADLPDLSITTARELCGRAAGQKSLQEPYKFTPHASSTN